MKKLFAIILSLGLIMAPVPAVHAAEGGGYAKQMLGLGNGIVGSVIITKCTMGQMQMSVMLYLAGSLVYVASEIAGAKKKSGDIDGQAAKLDQLKEEMKEGGDYQKAAIQAQLDDEKSNLKFIQGRRKWLMATKAIYTAAIAMAIIEYWWSFPPPAGLGKDDSAACNRRAESSKVADAVAMAYSSLMSSGGDMKGMATGLAMQVAFKKFGPKVKAITTAIDKGMDILDKSLGRAAWFAAALALVQVIDSGLAKEESASKKKIADLEKMLNDFNNITKPDVEIAEGGTPGGTNGGGVTSGATGGTPGTGGPNPVYEITGLPDGVTLPRTCYTTTKTNADYSEASCKNPYQFSRPRFDMDLKLPTLVAGVNAATDLGQAVANGDMAKADIAAGNLNAMAGNLESIKDNLMAKVNDELKAQGKKGIDVNGAIQKQVDALNSALNQSSPGSGNNTMASLGYTDAKAGAASVSDATDSSASGSNANMATAPTQETIALPETDLSSLSGLSEEGLGANGDSDLDQMLTDRTGKLAALERLDKNAGEGEIKQDTGASLFEQVSNRYFLNYSKIFERKKINPPNAPAPANQ